jgi:hypothetical protein
VVPSSFVCNFPSDTNVIALLSADRLRITSISIGLSFCTRQTFLSDAITLDNVDPLQKDAWDRVSMTFCSSKTCDLRDQQVLTQCCICRPQSFASCLAICKSFLSSLFCFNKVFIIVFSSSMSESLLPRELF